MKPLLALLAVFLITIFISWISSDSINYRLCGKMALSAMLVFTAMGHFRYKKGMALMLPASFPWKVPTIIITGIIELLAAIGILIPLTSRLTGILLIIFFIVILPSNIYAAFRNVNIETASFDGNGTTYLWFRIPLQLFFIGWTYIMVLK
jgi:uncharacterized membrane protein